MNLKGLIIIQLILNRIFLSLGQKDDASQCNQICQDCSSDKNFECLGCKYPYYFDQNNYNCVQSCPGGTYENQKMECVSCASKFCSSCSPIECYQCQPGYSVNPQDQQGCISNCQDGQYLLDGECVYECSIQSNIYQLDPSSNTCIQLQICPQLSYIPASQAVGQIQFFSTFISEDNSIILQIDEYGKVIIKSIPQLLPQAYYIFPELVSISDCVHLVEQSTQNKILSCMNSNTEVFAFYISSGLLLSQNITFNQQIANLYYLDGMKITFLTQSGQIVQYNFQSQQFFIVDDSSDNLNQILCVQNYQQRNDQYILAINSTNTIFYYDQSFNKNILLQYSTQTTLQMEYLNIQNMWAFYQNNKIDFYSIIFGQTPLLIKQITSQTVIYSILRSNQTLILIDDQNQTATQVFQISSNKQVTEITNTLPSTFFNSDCFWKTKDFYFSQKQDLLYIFNFIFTNFTLSYTLKLSQPLVCSITSLDVLQNNEKVYLLTRIKQDMQIQELTQSQLTSINSSQMYFSSEQHAFYYTQRLLNVPAVNFLNTATNNQILELKGNGIANQYDLESRQIAKQFYFWEDFYYPDQTSVKNFILYNFLVVKEEEKLILTGVKNGVLVIRELNLYTFEILLENQFSNIDIALSQIDIFDQPFYIQSTKTLIVYIINQEISDLYTELRQLHIFSYSQINNQYNYKFSVRQIVNDVQVSQTTGDVICFLVLQVYLSQIVIYNVYKDQNPVYVSEEFYNVCQNQIGFFNLNQDTIYYSDFFGGIMSMNLLKNYQKNIFSKNILILSYYLSPNLSYQIFSLSPYNTVQIVSTVDNKILQVITAGAYIPKYIRYDNKVFICSNTYTLSYYDGDANKLILYQNQYYGQNSQAFLHKQNQIIFINTNVYLTISLDDQNLQLQQVAQNAKYYPYQFNDIQIPITLNNGQVEQMVDVKAIFCYEYQSDDYLKTTIKLKVVNFYELDIQLNIYINKIAVIKYQKIIAQIAIDFLQPQQLVAENYRFYLLYDKKGFYFPNQKYMVVVCGYHIAFISSSNFEILFHYVSKSTYLNVAYDIELGYMAFIENLQDCIINLNAISKNCITNNYPFNEDNFHGTIIQRQKQLIIFYSQYSLRVYSLKEQIYKFVLYSTDFIPNSIYYNDFGSIIIIGDQPSQSFQILNLDTLQLLHTSFPAYSTQTFENLYNFYFFSDQIQVMLFSSYSNSIVIYNINTQESLKTIQLQYQFNYQSQVVVDENLDLIILIDNYNQIEIVSYDTNQVVKIFQLDKQQNDANTYQKILIWDNYKRKLFASSNNIFYVFDYDTSIFICKYQFQLPIFDIYISFNKNQIFVTDYLNLKVFDYSILEFNQNSLLPQNSTPNILKINDSQYILFDNSQSTLKNIVNGEVKDVKYFNQLNPSYFYFNYYNINDNQIYVITFNQLLIYNVTSTRINKIFSQLLDSQIITFISDSDFQVLFLTQKQSLYSLQKNQTNPQLLILTYISTGIGQFFMIDDSFLIYCSTKNTIQWNKMTFKKSQSLSLEVKLDQFQFKIELNDTVKKIVKIDTTQNIIILTNKCIQIIDIQTGNILQISQLDFQNQQSQIYFDPIYQRIYYADRIIGIAVYNLQMQTIKQNLPSSGIKLKMEGSFIFMLSFNSVSIYLRQDLKLFQIIRNFNSTQSLIDIEYTGFNNIFILYFDNSISFFNANPFSQPKLIDFLQVNNYKVLLQQVQSQNSQYLIVDMMILTIENTIKYTTQLNIGSFSNNICSAQLQILTDQNDLQTKNQQNDYLNLLSLKQLLIQNIIYSMFINNGEQTDLKYPFVSSSSVTNQYSLYIQAINNNMIYLKTQNSTDQNIVELQLQNLKISFKNLNNTLFLFGNPTFKKLERLFLNDIELSDFGNNQLAFDGIKHLFIQNLVINGEQIQQINKQIMLFQNIDIIVIQNINFMNCQFNNIINLLKFVNINKLTINNFNIKLNSLNSNFKQSSMINISYVNLLILDSANLLQNIFQNVQIFTITNVTSISISNLISSQNQIIINQNLDLQGIIFYFEATSQVDFKKIQFNMLNFTQYSSISLLKFSNVNETLQFNDFYFANFKLENNYNNSINGQQFFILECEGIPNSNFSNIQVINSDMIGFINLHDLKNKNGIIIQNQISTYYNYQHSLSNTNQLMQLNAQQIKISNSNFSSISSFNSDSNFIQIQVSQNLLLDTIQIQGVDLKQSSFINISQSPYIVIQNIDSKNIQTKSIASAFYMSQISSLIMKNNTFISNLSNLDGGVLYLNQITQIIFLENKFQQNQSKTGNGGAIYCFSSLFSQFEDNTFFQNSCPQGSGGAILLNNCDIQDMRQNNFLQNYALIGGAFRYQGIQPQVLQKRNVSRRILTLNLNTFIKNSVQLYGKNIGSYPIYLDVKNQMQDDLNIQSAKLENIQSGSTSSPILMRLIDEEMREISFFKNTEQINQEILIEFGSYLLELQSQEVGLEGNLRQNYNFDQFGFLFNVSYSYQPNANSSIIVKTVNPIYILNTTTFKFDFQELSISIDVNFRKCQQGEILQTLQKYKICYTCQQGNYCLQDPNKFENLQCLQCPIGSKNCHSNIIQLQNRYWSKDENSDQIYECINPENCIPEDPSNKFGCSLGHIGAMCESCDSKGVIWGSKYGKTNGGNQCQECIYKNKISSILLLFLLLIIFCVYLIFQFQKQMALIQKNMSWFYLRKLKIILLQNPNISSSSYYIKILINYFQFIALINNLGIQTKQFISFVEIGGGDPAKHSIYNLDCIFSYYDFQIPLYAIRVVFINTQIIIIYLFIQLVKILTNIFKIDDRSFQISSFILIYLFYSSSVIKVLIQSSSCIEIAGNLYIISEMQYECYTEEHIKILLYLIGPLLLIWLIIIPTSFSMYLYRKREKLQSLFYQQKYGLLYKEYKVESYYWDLARNQTKASLVIFLNLVRVSPLLKASFLIIFIQIYHTFLTKVSPYQRQQLNNIDQLSCKLIIISIFTTQMILLTDNPLLKLLLESILIVSNIIFIGILLLLAVQRPIPYNKIDQNMLQRLQFYLSQVIPNSIYQIAYQKQINLLRINSLWKKVQSSLREVISIEADFKNQKWSQRIKLSNQNSQFTFRKSKIGKQLKTIFYQQAKENCNLDKIQQ
ncbi:transmembrane protein, putative (macronuclear) [Tetrahymena thermophila SB210]|uniref:Transmembrane protein, putative n=1 Tax=Tetrahymena thermophila (strain SB210) TaxID=312017 RepID=Q232P3_TETTS|nr:transmembrane protein, putative [Tetrahymena thermophila SB210]EAR91509.2 transmembrane protein, putative [Tetrahymena thermophila SB210]|eukprot:XP_001011754.2 transmembrane protein, putative [Tetrahymena thermophila SB210]